MKIVLFLIFSILFIFSFYKRAEKSRIKNSLLFSLLLLLGLVGERWVLYGLHPTFFEGTSLIRSALFGFRFDFAAFCNAEKYFTKIFLSSENFGLPQVNLQQPFNYIIYSLYFQEHFL